MCLRHDSLNPNCRDPAGGDRGATHCRRDHHLHGAGLVFAPTFGVRALATARAASAPGAACRAIGLAVLFAPARLFGATFAAFRTVLRSEERRVGKGGW